LPVSLEKDTGNCIVFCFKVSNSLYKKFSEIKNNNTMIYDHKNIKQWSATAQALVCSCLHFDCHNNKIN